MAEKTLQWGYQIAKAYMQEVPGRDALARAYRSLPSVADDARRYAQRILEGRTHLEIPPYRTLGLLTETDAAKVEGLLGRNVAGFDYAIDQYAPKHIVKEHGDPKAEAQRGQRPVTAADYTRLPALLKDPDRMADGGTSGVGRPVVKYEKKFGGETYVAAFEVRGQRKTLALQSMWIRVGAPPR